MAGAGASLPVRARKTSSSVGRNLDDAAIGVDEIGLRRPTLDEVFLALTGSDAAAPATPPVTNGSSR